MDPTEKPDNGSSDWSSTPFGGDATHVTHVQPVPQLADSVLPGEQDDPRLC